MSKKAGRPKIGSQRGVILPDRIWQGLELRGRPSVLLRRFIMHPPITRLLMAFAAENSESADQAGKRKLSQ